MDETEYGVGFALEPEVKLRSGLSRFTRYRMAQEGTFPRAVALTNGKNPRKGVPRRLLLEWERAKENGEQWNCP